MCLYFYTGTKWKDDILFPCLPFLLLLYFSARINYRDGVRSKHTKDNGRKILKSVFGEVFLLEELSLGKGWGVGDGGGEVRSSRKYNKWV
jgi:hypothetical protein